MHRAIVVEGPFDWALMLRYARRRSRDLIDMVFGDEYHRLLVCRGRPFLLRAGPDPGQPQGLALSLLGIETAPEAGDVGLAESALRRVFSLDRSPEFFYQRVDADRVLGPLCRDLYGMRPLGSPTIFEMLINAVLGQQISMTAAHAIKQRLVLGLGAKATVAGRAYHAFPTPEQLAVTAPETLLSFKFSRRKAEYVRDLAQAVAEGRLDLEELRGRPHDEILARLLGIRGIGRWTAEYVLLRGYGDEDALPAGDAGLRRQVYRRYGLPRPPTEAELNDLAESWRPYRSWATLYLWSAEWATNPAVEDVSVPSMPEPAADRPA